MNEIVQYNTI